MTITTSRPYIARCFSCTESNQQYHYCHERCQVILVDDGYVCDTSQISSCILCDHAWHNEWQASMAMPTGSSNIICICNGSTTCYCYGVGWGQLCGYDVVWMQFPFRLDTPGNEIFLLGDVYKTSQKVNYPSCQQGSFKKGLWLTTTSPLQMMAVQTKACIQQC